ncbi:MAG: hypothetical protein ACREQP_21080 [Candidatus Binatia bacterium]
MTLRKQIVAILIALLVAPAFAFAQEKNGTISSYNKESREIVIKGKDWEQKAKVSSGTAKDQADLLKDGTKVTVEFDDRGGGDVRVKSLKAR